MQIYLYANIFQKFIQNIFICKYIYMQIYFKNVFKIHLYANIFICKYISKIYSKYIYMQIYLYANILQKFIQNLMNSLGDIRIFWGLVPKESPCIIYWLCCGFCF
jgi:hypothetical protein